VQLDAGFGGMETLAGYISTLKHSVYDTGL
jgi:hypothetical protein